MELIEKYNGLVNSLALELKGFNEAGVEYLPIPRCSACAGAGQDSSSSGLVDNKTGGPLFIIDAYAASGVGMKEERELLDKMVTAMKLSPLEVNILRITECGNNGSVDNPQPCFNEMIDKIKASKPEVIVTLGALPTRLLLGAKKPLKLLRGEITKCGLLDSPIMATYRPATLIKDLSKKGAAWNDLKLVMAELGLG